MSQFKITISSHGGGLTYRQDPPGPVSAGDEIFWYNDDNAPHWPGTAALQSAFMANQIAAKSSSDTFVPGPDVAGKTIAYIDTLNAKLTGSSIVVRPMWTITITVNPQSGAITYAPAALTGVAVGDQVVWNNKDTVKPHWPAAADNSTYFMDAAIPPGSSSSPFVPDASGTLSYIDFLNPKAAGGTIAVKGAQ